MKKKCLMSGVCGLVFLKEGCKNITIEMYKREIIENFKLWNYDESNLCTLHVFVFFMTTPSTIIIGGGGKVQLKNILRKISRGYDARPLATGHNGAPNECQIMCTNINVTMFRLKSATKLVIFLIPKYIQYIV